MHATSAQIRSWKDELQSHLDEPLEVTEQPALLGREQPGWLACYSMILHASCHQLGPGSGRLDVLGRLLVVDSEASMCQGLTG